MCAYHNNGSIRERYEMPMQILPAASLRSGNRLPAARALVWACNHLIWMALWPIRRAIFGVALNFLPALREARAARCGIGGFGRVPADLPVSRLPRGVIACTFDRRAPERSY